MLWPRVGFDWNSSPEDPKISLWAWNLFFFQRGKMSLSPNSLWCHWKIREQRGFSSDQLPRETSQKGSRALVLEHLLWGGVCPKLSQNILQRVKRVTLSWDYLSFLVLLTHWNRKISLKYQNIKQQKKGITKLEHDHKNTNPEFVCRCKKSPNMRQPTREKHSHYFCSWRLGQSYWERVMGWIRDRKRWLKVSYPSSWC